MPSVILADDEKCVRYFLKTAMDSLFFDVVAEVEKGDELIDAMRKNQPDILLLDINMPNLTGIEFLQKYASMFPHTCIILLTSSSLATLIGETSFANVQCFLRKNTPSEEMIEFIKQAWTDFPKLKIETGA